MSVIKEMSDLFSAVAEKDAAITKQIEAVMLHVRARQMLLQERKHILFSVLVSLATRIIIGVLGFFAAPYFRTAIFILCLGAAVVAFFLSGFGEINPWLAAVTAYLTAYLLSNLKGTMDFFRALLFDLLDLLSFGTLTKYFSKMIVDGEMNGSNLLLATANKWYQPTPIAYHFYESRHPAIANRGLQRIEEEFMTLAVERTSDGLALEECKKYWAEFTKQSE